MSIRKICSLGLLQRYLLREWWRAFAGALGMTLGILLLEDMYREFQDLIRLGATLYQILYYYFLLIPGFSLMLIPISIFVATLFVFSKFHRTNEIIAMRISGISLFSMTRNFWILGFFFSLVLLYFNGSFVPRAQLAAERLRLSLSKQADGSDSDACPGSGRQIAYSNIPDGRIWIVEQLDPLTSSATGIYVYQYGSNGWNRLKIYAEKGHYGDGHWSFERGEESLFEKEANELKFQRKFEEKAFFELTESPQSMIEMQKRPKDLSLQEVSHVLSRLPPYFANYRVYLIHYHSILAGCWSALIAMMCAIPNAIGGVRRSSWVGMAKAFGLLALFYILSNIASVLGANGLLSPVIAAWLPNCILILLSGYQLYRAR